MTAGRHAKQPADGAAWVAGGFPLAGSYDADRVLVAADAVAELVRWLAHATYPAHRVVAVAPHAYAVLGRLATAVASLGQVCDQLADQLAVVADDPTLRADVLGVDLVDPASEAVRAAGNAGGAGSLSRRVADRLSAAQAATGRLYHQDTATGEVLPSGGGR